MAIKDTKELKPGDVVRYSDMANRARTYVIIEIPNETHRYDFKMVQIAEDGDDWNPTANYSDCRQHGWDLVQAIAA